jgi:glutathione S-transferase
MRLFTTPIAPNALRVVMFMREKQLTMPIVNVDLGNPQAKEAYRAINPLAQVPALELDDGAYLSESLTICQYLDAISGAPHLFGESLTERTQIAMWERRAELSLFIPAIEYGHHTHPMMRDAFQQFPDWAQTQIPKVNAFYTLMNVQLAAHDYLAGNAFSVADITAYIGAGAATFFGLPMPQSAAITAWRKRIDSRDSAKNLFPGTD